MAYASSVLAPRDLPRTQTPARSGLGLWQRLLAAMMETRRHQADREIAHYLASTGGKFTDETEREIERRFLSTPSRW